VLDLNEKKRSPAERTRAAMIASRPFETDASHSTAMPRKTTPERSAPLVPPSAPSKTLQAFANPAPERDYVIRFDVPEFTCLCPLTGQPDFAHFSIEVVADKLCVETKSLKQYFWSYRSEGAFHEKVTNTIVSDLVKAIAPRFLRIHADWYVRGGIRTYVTVEHRKKGWKPAAPVLLPAGAIASASE
jgi:7-cyano-7-deazaguanine reductase